MNETDTENSYNGAAMIVHYKMICKLPTTTNMNVITCVFGYIDVSHINCISFNL